MATINLQNLPRDTLSKQSKIFLNDIEERTKQSIDYIHDKFKYREKLEESITFINLLFLDGFKPYINISSKIGFLPSNEAQIALQASLNQALIGDYRAAYDHLRRALEMMSITVYFSLDTLTNKEARNWFDSKSKTPFFNKVIKKICNDDVRFKEFDAKFNWRNQLQGFYWDLCDFTHINGFTKSYWTLGMTCGSISGVYVPSISLVSLDSYLTTYIKCVTEICTILALYNPILLVNIPIDQKYGFYGPLCGFFQYGQPEILKALFPDEYKEYFDKLQENDREVSSLVDFFNSLPDLTEEQLDEQAKQLGYDQFDK